MLQQIIITSIFSIAVIYVGRIIYRSFQANASCASGCGKCSAVDFNKIEEQIKAKTILQKVKN